MTNETDNGNDTAGTWMKNHNFKYYNNNNNINNHKNNNIHKNGMKFPYGHAQYDALIDSKNNETRENSDSGTIPTGTLTVATSTFTSTVEKQDVL